MPDEKKKDENLQKLYEQMAGMAATYYNELIKRGVTQFVAVELTNGFTRLFLDSARTKGSQIGIDGAVLAKIMEQNKKGN